MWEGGGGQPGRVPSHTAAHNGAPGWLKCGIGEREGNCSRHVRSTDPHAQTELQVSVWGRENLHNDCTRHVDGGALILFCMLPLR